MLIVCGIIYVIFAKSELQSWNQVDSKNRNDMEKELEVLTSSTNKTESDLGKKIDKLTEENENKT